MRYTMRILGLLCILLSSLYAADATGPDPAEVTALKDLVSQATEAFNRQDVAAMEQVLAPRFVLVMGDQHMATDRAALQAGVERWCKGADAPFASIEFHPTVDRHAELLAPGVVTAAGTSQDVYHFKNGKVVEVASRWTATVVKTAAGWRVAQLHLGIDPIDNPMMREAAKMVAVGAGIAGVAGLLIGGLIGWLLGRRRSA